MASQEELIQSILNAAKRLENFPKENLSPDTIREIDYYLKEADEAIWEAVDVIDGKKV